MKPMMFNAEMYKAVLENRKTVTRRPVKPRYREGEYGFRVISKVPSNEYVRVEIYDEWEEETRWLRDPYRPGDICYVPEPWKYARTVGDMYAVIDFKDGEDMLIRFDSLERADKWRKYLDKPRANWQSPYFMPREAARLFLRVTGIRVERLHDITNEDAVREGCDGRCLGPSNGADCCLSVKTLDFSREKFSTIWDSTVRPVDLEEYGWAANPWVWVIEFERISSSEAYKADAVLT